MIISDWLMPEMDGPALFRKIRGSPRDSRLRDNQHDVERFHMVGLRDIVIGARLEDLLEVTSGIARCPNQNKMSTPVRLTAGP